jgi:hypothetical protein
MTQDAERKHRETTLAAPRGARLRTIETTSAVVLITIAVFAFAAFITWGYGLWPGIWTALF